MEQHWTIALEELKKVYIIGASDDCTNHALTLQCLAQDSTACPRESRLEPEPEIELRCQLFLRKERLME